MRLLPEHAVRELLRDLIEFRYGSQAEAARIWGVSKPFVNMVLSGQRAPTDVMLQELGAVRVTLYQLP